MAKDYYEVLGIDRKATKEDVKKAFRTLAHKHHPDKKGGNEAKFKEINEAYTVLSDDAKRKQYDSFGSGGMGGGFNPGQGGFGGFGGGAQGFDFSQYGGENGFAFDLGDIFGDMFGGGRNKVRRGRDISIDIEVDFKESIFGGIRTMLIRKTNTCSHCKGSGGEPSSKMQTCATCSGKGKIQETRSSLFGTFSTITTCTMCHGKGEVPVTPCNECKGAGVLKEEKEIRIAVPPGIEDGEMIRMTGGGEAIQHGSAGDLYVKIHVKPHPHIKKEGFDLVMPLSVKISEALLGATKTIETLEGKLDIAVPAGSKHGEEIKVRGKGVPAGADKRGTLRIKLDLDVPKKISSAARDLVEKLKQEGL